MRIAVCIKQVPDTTDLKIDPETNTLIREGVAAVLNPLDEFPLEAALELSEATGGSVSVFAMGPPSADEVLRKATAMGANDGVLVCDRHFAGADTWATSLTLARAIEEKGPFDLIMCGKQAIDGDTAQVGPGIAAHMGIPQVTYVTGIKISDVPRTVVVKRLLDEQTARLQVALPAVLTVLKECSEPRLPTLAGRIASLEEDPVTVSAGELKLDAEVVGLQGSPTRVVKITTPELRRKHCRLNGTAEEMAGRLLDILKDRDVQLPDVSCKCRKTP